MYEELVEQLRMQAALIDSDLDNQAEETLDFCRTKDAEIIRLVQECSRLKRERDQAVEDLNTLRKRSDWKCEACYYNDHYNRDICTGCEYNNDNNWQWRGVQEEKHETD